jgi:hypothetical protein
MRTTVTVEEREAAGQLAWHTWRTWAQTQPAGPEWWKTDWDKLPEEQREVYRMIGEVIMRSVRTESSSLIEEACAGAERWKQEAARIEGDLRVELDEVNRCVLALARVIRDS